MIHMELCWLSVIGRIKMGFVMPYEDIGRVKVGGVDWIIGVGNSIQSRLNACLLVRFNFSDCSWKLAEINTCVDEGWKIIRHPFQVGHCTIIYRMFNMDEHGMCCPFHLSTK